MTMSGAFQRRKPMTLTAAFRRAEEQMAREAEENAQRIAQDKKESPVKEFPKDDPFKPWTIYDAVERAFPMVFGVPYSPGAMIQVRDRDDQPISPTDGNFMTPVAKESTSPTPSPRPSRLLSSPKTFDDNTFAGRSKFDPNTPHKLLDFNDQLDEEAPQLSSKPDLEQFAPLPPIEFQTPLVGRPSTPSDFTADDLQVSNSPRIHVPRPAVAQPAVAQPAVKRTSPRSNARLEELRQREEAVYGAGAFPPTINHRPREEEAARSVTLEDHSTPSTQPAAKKTSRRYTPRLEELRQRELEVYGEIRPIPKPRAREEAARSVTPEDHKDRQPGVKAAQRGLDKEAKLKKQLDNIKALGLAWRREKQSSSDSSASVSASASVSHESYGDLRGGTLPSKPVAKGAEKDGQLELLRKLSRVAMRNSSSSSSSSESTKAGDAEQAEVTSPVASMSKKPTVGFAGLRKNQSDDSLDEKRRSLANSESDPTDRIEAEMSLFALQDNCSEKESNRAPSPGVPESLEPAANPAEVKQLTPKIEVIPKIEVTPKIEVEPPTPKVVGAYIETPVTKPRATKPRRDPFQKSAKVKPRRKPLANTSFTPSVKEDLVAILRRHHVDDSTIENFDQLLDNDIEHEELEKMVDDTVIKVKEELEGSNLTPREHELETYFRMQKTLRTGLLNIRSAKQGIERLEDKVTHSKLSTAPQAVMNLDLAKSPLVPSSSNGDWICVSLPKLYRRQPKFKLTIYGMLTLLFFIWAIFESTFCHLFVTQSLTCDDCIWYDDEPYFPYAMPFMVDEWTTGGKGRECVLWIGREIGDGLYDIADWMSAHDLTNDDEFHMDTWERKRHRRRLRRRGSPTINEG